jgi:hypothetical protein
MPRNTAFQQGGLSAFLVRTLGLYYNVETFYLKFVNKIPISGPNMKVASKTMPSKNSSHNFRIPFLMKKLAKGTKIMRVNMVCGGSLRCWFKKC